MKAWLFLEDVTPENGPFTYVPGSQQLRGARLSWEYARSRIAARMHDGYSEKGSFRIDDDALPALQLPAPQSMAVAANTLVVANTHGFHRRGTNTHTGATRLAIWCSNRGNPFNPWLGLGTRWERRLRDWAYRTHDHALDRRAARTNKRASWHWVQVEGL